MKPLVVAAVLGVVGVVVVITAGGTGEDRPAPKRNGFDLSNAVIPVEEILSGGPPRDGIPALLEPAFLPVAKTRYMRPQDQLISIADGKAVKAYPLRILIWHEIVNDRVGDRKVAVTYCPLCGTGMVFDREVAGRTLTFGVSGLLYQSDLLMYDRETESLWSQLRTEAVTGPLAGTDLEWLPAVQLSWEAWRKQYPDGLVLSTATGFRRDYERTPYAGYETVAQTMFPVPRTRTELGNKTWVAGVIVNDQAAAYPLDELPHRQPITDTVDGQQVHVFYEEDSRAVRIVHAATGRPLPVVKAYWFAWQAFYPETRLWRKAE